MSESSKSSEVSEGSDVSDVSVVLGAGGGIGSAVVAELLERGRTVRAVGRRLRREQVPDGVAVVTADVGEPAGAAEAVRGAAVVYHCAQPAYERWGQDFPPMNKAIVDAVEDVGAKLVFADNLYRYGPVHEPLTEDMPFAATDAKGRVRARLAEELLAAHEAGRLRVTLGCASDYFGARGVDTALGTAFFGRLVEGRPAQWIGRLDQPHTMNYLPDLARGLVTLGEDDRADGRAWHLPADAATGEELLDLTGAVLGRRVRAQVASPWLLRLVGVVVPMMRELAGISHQWTGPWVADHAAFDQTFGPLPVTPLSDAVAETVRWWQKSSG